MNPIKLRNRKPNNWFFFPVLVRDALGTKASEDTPMKRKLWKTKKNKIKIREPNPLMWTSDIKIFQEIMDAYNGDLKSPKTI